MIVEWLRWVLGLTVPLLIGHGIWATLTILRLRQIVEGPDGKNGLKNTVADLDAWRYGKGTHGPGDLETRFRHAARNLDQEMVEKIEQEMKLERRKIPRRGHS